MNNVKAPLQTEHDVQAEWDEAQAISALVSGLVDTIANVKALVGAYAEEPHSDGCGMDACVRCVVDEFAALVLPSVPETASTG